MFDIAAAKHTRSHDIFQKWQKYTGNRFGETQINSNFVAI